MKGSDPFMGARLVRGWPCGGMPRKPREEEAGAIHHVYARGNDKRLIYEDDADRFAYLAMLGTAVERHGWLVMAYCLMDNHMHLLVETPKPNLGTGMRRLHGDYALRFNRRHRRCGHLFQGRYGATRVRDDGHLMTAVRYIVANPVMAGLCDRPEEWVWCSTHAVVAGDGHVWLAHARLLDYLAGIGGGAASTRFAELLEC
jgi:putative transposase